MRLKFIKPLKLLVLITGLAIAFQGNTQDSQASDNTDRAVKPTSYQALLTLFTDWRVFERPDSLNGAPDYTVEAMRIKHQQLQSYQDRLSTFDISHWPVEQQVDYHLVRAEMNGLDFNIRVLRPWQRDPAFYTSIWTYQSDTPAHEGPTHAAIIELWTYSFPLSVEAEAKLTAELQSIPPLLQQARINLTGNARDLWVAGIKNITDQASDLQQLAEQTSSAGNAFQVALKHAQHATGQFAEWLQQQATSKTGPSGVGKQHYTWYLQNVHLVPLSWEEEVTLLKRELDRAHASLRLEEHRNRNLPPLKAISSEEEYAVRADQSVTQYISFLRDQDILPVRDYMDPAIRVRTGEFVPEETRNFFWTAVHFEPMTLWTHFYHWFDLARMQVEPHPSPIRRGPSLYNIFDSRAEGLATGVEEMMMQAGLYDDNPRAREIVYIMLAQRAARGLGSLYAQANIFSMQQARDFHVEWTPRGWMRDDLDLLGFEQQLYLRQPGYGTSYITGKYLIERLLAERGKQLEPAFKLSDFYAEIDAAGVIPVALLHWQLTGNDEDVQGLLKAQQ